MSDHPAPAPPVTAGLPLPDGRDATELLVMAELGREVSSVLDLDELLRKIPELIARLTAFTVFSVYLLDESRESLRIAYAVGYPEEAARTVRLRLGEGIVGTAVAEGRPVRVEDVSTDARYVPVVPGVVSELVVPLRHKGQVLGALNLLSDRRGEFTEQDERALRQFAAHVSQALVNARLFETERSYADTLETLAEIGREMSAILDLDALLTRMAQLLRRLINYRIFGIALLNDSTQMLELKVAIQYGDSPRVLEPVKLGEGIVGHAALTRQPVLVDDVTRDPRYISAVEGVRSELAIPLVHQDRCIGVFDLESPDLAAFTKQHVELLTLLASQAAVAIENARLYEEIRANERRIEKELAFAQQVQRALLPQELPKRLKGVDVAWHFDSARELGGDLYDFLSPEPQTLAVVVGDVTGKGVPAALYGAFVGELVRGRTFRRRLETRRSTPASVLMAMNRILHERQLEGYFCTLCYALFDLRRRQVTFANSGLPYPIRVRGGEAESIPMPGMPLGTFDASTYDEVTLDLQDGDCFVFCSDGIFEAFNDAGEEFGTARVIETVRALAARPAREVVQAVFDAMRAFRGDASQTDDQTVVVVRLTGA